MKTVTIRHDSAESHVTGQSVFVNDMEISSSQLVGRVVYSPLAHGIITQLDYSRALKLPGVAAILSAKDIPGHNQMGPVVKDEPCLAWPETTFIGQAILLIAAETMDAAIRAEKMIRIQIEPMEATLSLHSAIEKELLIAPPAFIRSGDAESAIKLAPFSFDGILETGSQEHWYLETQSALAVPGEGKEMMVFASSQNPSETQTIVADVLGISKHLVDVEVKRMGGAFGGKETQANHVAAWASLLAQATGKPVKMHLSRDDDQLMTGKRHRFLSKYRIGFDKSGLILAYIVELNSDAGATTDLSLAILERAMLHAENAYFIPNISITGKAYRTNLPPNTAFRGFGGPQGMAVIENAIDRIARFLEMDPAVVRKRNFYGFERNRLTPYGKQITNNRLHVIFERLTESSEYFQRRVEIQGFNNKHKYQKRGIALTPVKFGISFTTAFLNQAGALVHIYNDGSVQVNHGGTEMGQGLHTKMIGVTADALGISPDRVRVTPTSTSKVPNTSATAASSGSDLNGMAIKNAAETLKHRLIPLAVQLLVSMGCKEAKAENLIFERNLIFDKNFPAFSIRFEQMAETAWKNQISLSSTGFYKTPDLLFDRKTGKGNPFYYYAYGMAVSEVELDVLTGAYTLLRTDILHDVGDSLNEDIDIGQIEGAFIQGVGWCTREEIKWNEKGFLLTHSPDTYKIPTINDIPVDFRISLLHDFPNEGTIRKSKAVGEPPFMLAFSVWLAIKDAISAVRQHRIEPAFTLPATPEFVLLSMEALKNELD